METNEEIRNLIEAREDEADKLERQAAELERQEAAIHASNRALYDELRKRTGCDCFAARIDCTGHEVTR